MGYNIPVAVFGGSAPFIATYLVNATGDITSPMHFFIGCTVLSFLAAAFTTQKNYQRVREADADLMEKVATSYIPTVEPKK
ncbi:MAG: hypothetical protein Q4A03_00705 [Rothia sp. (in: high G+C Gram-positive bacteria)]|uniref:hypothetical protein n=1 Tax=Rothia sp. (in: high G+C Gram-positive bacteria) TaxID=1885016 RepID=UPI00270EB6A8|nr:hypothetical protein [Rothia sp. (in: high G+C Gram-positive bacteria)]